jgi:hypothetical protein
MPLALTAAQSATVAQHLTGIHIAAAAAKAETSPLQRAASKKVEYASSSS